MKKENLLVAMFLDKYKLMIKTNEIINTNFLTPNEQLHARDLILKGTIKSCFLFGGTAEAERKQLVFFPDYYDENKAKAVFDNIICLRINPKVGFGKLVHKDYLGALLGLGLKREKIGDIFVSENEARVFVCREIKDFITGNLLQVGRYSCEVSIQTEVLPLQNAEMIEEKIVIASLRLDVVIAATFRMARTKASQTIIAGMVQVNWLLIEKPDQQLKMGDTISVRKKGRIEIIAVEGISKKQRIIVIIKKYCSK